MNRSLIILQLICIANMVKSVYIRHASSKLYLARDRNDNEKLTFTDRRENAMQILRGMLKNSMPHMSKLYDAKDGKAIVKSRNGFKMKNAQYSYDSTDAFRINLADDKRHFVLVTANGCMKKSGDSLVHERCSGTSEDIDSQLFDLIWDYGNDITTTPYFIAGKIGDANIRYARPVLNGLTPTEMFNNLIQIADEKWIKNTEQRMKRANIKMENYIRENGIFRRQNSPKIIVKINVN